MSEDVGPVGWVMGARQGNTVEALTGEGSRHLEWQRAERRGELEHGFAIGH